MEVEEILELTLEVTPADIEDSLLDIYRSLARTPLKHVEWRGYSIEPLGFGINFVLATCRVFAVPGAPEPDDIIEAASSLPGVQGARMLHSRSIGSEDMDPYDLCWLHPMRSLSSLSSAAASGSRGGHATCGIVSTFRDAPCLVSWLRFHLAVGFSHVWLYADAPQDEDAEALALAASLPGVQVVPRDEKLRSEWKLLAGWKTYGPVVDLVGDHSAVMARQCLNGEHAAGLAEQAGCEWLLHIDLDELACPAAREEGGAASTSMPQIFAAASAAGANSVVFANHEVAPESEGPYADPFQEATLFKVSERLRSPGKGVSRFLAYGNGKSAVRVGGGARPDGVHKWMLKSPAVLLLSPEDGFLLHYVNCGFDAITRKYAILGAFQDKWFGRDIALSTPFHTAARDAAQAGPQALQELYRLRVMYDADKAASLIHEGALIRIRTPCEVLAASVQ